MTARPVLLGRSTGSWHLTMTGPRRATDTNPSLRGKKSQYYTVSTSIKLIRRMSSSVSVMVGGIKYGTGEGSGRKPYRMQATARSTVHDWSKLQCSHRYSTIRLLLQLPAHCHGPWTSSTLRSMHQLASDGAHLQRARSCKHPKMQIGRWRKRSLPLPVQAWSRVRALIEPPKIINYSNLGAVFEGLADRERSDHHGQRRVGPVRPLGNRCRPRGAGSRWRGPGADRAPGHETGAAPASLRSDQWSGPRSVEWPAGRGGLPPLHLTGPCGHHVRGRLASDPQHGRPALLPASAHS